MTTSFSNSDFELTDKIALVTGATSGIGEALSLAFANAGADLLLVARRTALLEKIAKKIERLGRKAWVFTYDLEKITGIEDFFTKINQEVKNIDILINAAGTIFREASITFPYSEWQRIMDINLNSVFILSQCFARARIQKNLPGKIINIASLTSEASRPTIPAYTASKGAIKQLTKALAVEWAPNNINVNAIGPGYINTEFTSHLVENSKFNKWILESTPMKRWGVASDLAGSAIFLASRASDFITGQVLYVDGGFLANL